MLVVSVVDRRFRRLRLDEDSRVAADAPGADLRERQRAARATAHADWECGIPAGSLGNWLISHLTGDELVTLRRRIDG